MTGDDLILLADGVAIGVDACLLVHFGGRIWGDFRARRHLRASKPSTAPLSTEQLIAWGAAHSSSRVQALAGRARYALTDLRRAYEQAGKVAEADAHLGAREGEK